MGSSLGVSILGAIYASRLTDSLAHSAGGATGPVSASSMTPQALRALPEAVQHVFQQAVTDGITSLFLLGSVVAAAGIVVALFIRHVPLRGGKTTSERPAPEAAMAELEAAV
jgi:hypothetical protein